MALTIGTVEATTGMTKAIYDKLDEVFGSQVPPADLAKAQDGWRDLAFAIAGGLVPYLVANLEVTGLRVSGNAQLAVAGNAASGAVTLNQSGPTQGLVR
jgi:hypothetical protein